MPKTSHVLLTLFATVACSVAAIDGKLLEKAEQGNADAQFSVGVLYANGQGTLKDPKKAFEWFLKSAEQGDASAQYNVGVRYAKGEGTLKNLKKAAFWIKKANAGGHENSSKVWELFELWKYDSE